MTQQPLMFTITGPSCAGKTTLLNKLIERHPEVFAKLPSATTRAMRPDEIEGDEYYFVSPEQFVDDHGKNLFCQTVNYKGVDYGTYTRDLQSAAAAGKVPIRVVEPSGVYQFEQACKPIGMEVFSIFVPGDLHTLFERWLERYAATDEPRDTSFYANRMVQTVISELNWITEQDYDYYFDTDNQDEYAMIYALSRIATGKFPLDRARRLTNRAA